jgi:dTDP-4-dehydrorhamnose reductase
MIWIIGNKGMLGTELELRLKRDGIPFTGTDREVDITDPAALEAFARSRDLAGEPLGWIVNCAAFTAVDKAEDEPELARKLNAGGAGNIARTARKIGAKMIQISTDYVFGGKGNRPWREDDPIAPEGVYARTKAEGEAFVREGCGEHFIIRTAWLYGKHGPNFVYTMLRLMKEKDSIGVIADQRGTPTRAADLASFIAGLIVSGSAACGTYHYTNEGETTWYDFAREIHRLGRSRGLLERDCVIKPLRTEEYPTKAKRPAYSVMSKDKCRAVFGVTPPEWKESLAAFFKEPA